MSLLKTAVKAKIPLIGIQTDDPGHFPLVLDTITGRQSNIIRWNPVETKRIDAYMNIGQLGVAKAPPYPVNWDDMYARLEKDHSTLVIMNPEDPPECMLNVGAVTVPPYMTRNFVEAFTNEDPAPLAAALSGLSLLNMNRVVAMATAEYGELTPRSVRAVRRELFQISRGLEEIESDQLFYESPKRITEWLGLEGRLFKTDTHPLLTPRGFLFKGQPGTGKTSGAKYIAHQLRVPLYKLDVGMLLGRYVGQSDERLNTALRQADSFEPCVLLIDEVEKLFEMSDSSGVVQRLLGHMLWWLQEHQSKVLVIMTTNDDKKIPPEMYRAGRVDEVVEFIGLAADNVLSFVKELADRLKSIYPLNGDEIYTLADEMTHMKYNVIFPQAVVTEQVLRAIKLKVINQTKE